MPQCDEGKGDGRAELSIYMYDEFNVNCSATATPEISPSLLLCCIDNAL